MFEFIAGVVVGGITVAALNLIGTMVIERYFGSGE